MAENKTPKIETFKAKGGHSPEIRDRTCSYTGTVEPVSVRVEGDKLIQTFRYLDGPNKGKTFSVTTKARD